MRNKDKAFDILNDVCKEYLPEAPDQDNDAARITEIEDSIMSKLEKVIDDKFKSYEQQNVDNVDKVANGNNSKNSNNDNVDNGGSEDGNNEG